MAASSEEARMASVGVHGGAGSWSAERLPAGIEGCVQAAIAGAAALPEGAVAAVVAAVKVLEGDPHFSAGYGSALTREETIELDAAVMSGDLRFGAVGACPPVDSAIAAALAVYEHSEHALLVGEGALAFVKLQGVAPLGPDDLVTERARERLAEMRATRESGAEVQPGAGTVGAVAVDEEGNLASATSTGGIIYKMRGRVGDTPLPGAGTYADEEAGGASSATGHGESILRVLLCRDAVERVGRGDSVKEAADASVALLQRKVGGEGGLILIDRMGNFAAARNTSAMPWAVCRPGEAPGSGS